MDPVNFDSEMQKHRNADVKSQKQLDDRFGEGSDVISIIGVAHFGERDMAVARMIAPDEILPFGPTIEVKRDLYNNILFISNNLLLMGVPWDERLDVFAEVGAEVGYFMFEAISPTKLTRALVQLDGKVIGTVVRDITPDEYEKHLSGFYDESDAGFRVTANLDKPMEC